MKENKKLAALFCILLTGLLAGCNGGGQSSSSMSSSAEPSSSSAEPVSSSSKEEPSSSSETPSSSSSSSSSSSEAPTPHVHTLEFVDLVPSTKEANGVADHFICKECHALVDSLGNEIEASDLVLPKLAENSIFTDVLEHGAEEGLALYTELDGISKDYVDGQYLIGVNGEGVIIYAGRFGGGFGGPGDGFYHDGSYEGATPGQICGIFDVGEEWAKWPATTPSGDPAWNEFELVVPEDGFILAGDNEAIVDLVVALAPQIDSGKFLAETNNETFEIDITKGKFNNDRLVLLDGDLYGQISLNRTVMSGLFLEIFDNDGKLTKKTELEPSLGGVIEEEFSLVTWGHAELLSVDALGVETHVWFDNTTISGAVTPEAAEGADWTARLYHHAAKKGYFYACVNANYLLQYDTTANTLVFYTANELIIEGAYNGIFVPNDKGVTSYSFTSFFAQWQGVTIRKVTEELEFVYLTHETATFSGDVINSTTASWNEKLYRDDKNMNKYITCLDNGGTYLFKIELGSEADTVDVTYFLEGVRLDNTSKCSGSFEKQLDGSFKGVVDFTGEWGCFELLYTDDNGQTIKVFYDNAELSGDVTDVTTKGCQWDGKLYHEGEDKFLHAYKAHKYELVYTPAHDKVNAKLNVTLIEHNFSEFVDLVPSSATTHGVMDHSKCATCPILGNSKGDVVTAAELEMPLLDANAIFTQVGKFGKNDGIAIYRDSDEIVKNDILGKYVVGVSAEGKVIYASRTGDFGGPSDGFYHDGSYVLTPGEVCGIFDVGAEFAPWPNKTASGEDAWTQFTYKVPAGGLIIAGTQAQMAQLILSLSPAVDTNLLGEKTNAALEGLAKGALDNAKIGLIEGDLFGQLYVTRKVSLEEGFYITVKGTDIPLTPSAEGIYSQEFELNAWNRIEIFSVNAEGYVQYVNHSTATIVGAVTAADVIGADWTVRLFHDNVSSFAACTNAKYKMTYNPTTKVLEVLTPGAVVVSGAYNTICVPASDPITYSFVAQFPGWNGVTLSKVLEDFTLAPLNHETATFSGDVVDSTDDPYTGSLYRDPDNTNKYIAGQSGGTYKFDITLGDADTVKVTHVVEGVYLTPDSTAIGSLSLQSDGSYAGTIDGGGTGWKFVGFTYTDANGNTIRIFYENTTISGDVTPADADGDQWDGKLYHEASNPNLWVLAQKGEIEVIYTPAKDGNPATLVFTILGD